jgi:hypothetical protein
MKMRAVCWFNSEVVRTIEQATKIGGIMLEQATFHELEGLVSLPGAPPLSRKETKHVSFKLVHEDAGTTRLLVTCWDRTPRWRSCTGGNAKMLVISSGVSV